MIISAILRMTRVGLRLEALRKMVRVADELAAAGPVAIVQRRIKKCNPWEKIFYGPPTLSLHMAGGDWPHFSI
jgi:hypothetical protein